MWLAQSMKQAVPTADADQGISTIVGDQMGVVTRGEVRQLPIYGPGGYVWLPESGASVLVIKGGPGGDSFPLWRILAADCGLWTGCVLRNGRLRRNSMYWRPSGMSRA